MSGYEIQPATPDHLPKVRDLLREYVEWIGLDLGFQEIDAELDALPGDYAPPRGVLLVACPEGGEPVAMIALRPAKARSAKAGEAPSAKAGEMKRLYVQPSARGQGLARALIVRLLDEARALGYHEIRLDTLPMMGDAQGLYVALGFHDIAPYYDTPIAGTRFMGLRL
ncbi:MAG: GNAT family N-acetyltransferase [Vicinamibacterales bacterium]